MELLWGKHAQDITASDLARRVEGYRAVLLDLGTGDGRFVTKMAAAHPDVFAIGLDACRENLRERSRRAPSNALFVVGNALTLPADLDGLATHVTINFPWGSLLRGLLEGEACLMDRLVTVTRPQALLELRLNGGALAEAGVSLDEGERYTRRSLTAAGFVVQRSESLGPEDLRACQTTWAQRLAFGRDPHAVYIQAQRGGDMRR